MREVTMVDFHMEIPERSQAKMGNFDARGAGKPRVHHTGPGRVQRHLQHKVAFDALFIVNDDRNLATRPSFTCITTVTCQRHKFGNCDSAGSHTAGRSSHPKDLAILVWQRGMSRVPEQQGTWFGTR